MFEASRRPVKNRHDFISVFPLQLFSDFRPDVEKKCQIDTFKSNSMSLTIKV